MDCSVVIAVWFSFEFETPSPIFVILSSFVLERGEFKAADKLVIAAVSGPETGKSLLYIYRSLLLPDTYTCVYLPLLPLCFIN